MFDGLLVEWLSEIYLLIRLLLNRVTELSDERDLILLKEMISREIFSSKKESPDRGKAWESIQEFLNQKENPN